MKVLAIMDMQFGSTGKGLIAGTLARLWKPDTVATAWGPNAGHTFRDGDRIWVHRMLATSALAPSVQTILIGPGTVLDLKQLREEMILARNELVGKTLIIHPQAVILGLGDSEQERKHLSQIGSTMKGTAAAAIRKMWRGDNIVAGHQMGAVLGELAPQVRNSDMAISVSSKLYDRAIDRSRRLILEGAQGYSLGIHTDFYPYTTSRDVSTAQLLADCRVPTPSEALHVMGVARTFPIRVANRPEGTSGGCYPDQEEISWADISREPELTTVTKLPRRIFTFSDQQLSEAVRVCNAHSLALTFCDYLNNPDDIAGQLTEAVVRHVRRVERVAPASPVKLMSFGPRLQDVFLYSARGLEAPGDFDWDTLLR